MACIWTIFDSQMSHRLQMASSILVTRDKMKVKKSLRKGLLGEVSTDISFDWSYPPEPAIVMGSSLEFGDSILHQKQLALALQQFGHFSVFCYSSLFGLGKGGIRHEHGLLLPFLKILAHASQFFSPSQGSLSVHPFKATDSLVHPEELFPYDQLHFYDQVPPEAAFIPSKGTETRRWGEKSGGRHIVTDNGELIKLNRRTLRRNLKMKQRRKEVHLDAATERKQLLDLPKRKKTMQTVAELSEFMPMRNWEALKMSAAIPREAGSSGDCLMRGNTLIQNNDLQYFKSTLDFTRQVNGEVLNSEFQVKIHRIQGHFGKAFCCIPSQSSQNFSLLKVGWEYAVDFECLAAGAWHCLQKWRGQ
eukprot:c25066_g1_i1 orf=593-1675(+)